MAERERVRAAIQGPVDHADKLLEGLQGADLEIRLRVIVDGWGRGLAAGLEELAIAVEELRERRGETAPEVTVPEPRVAKPDVQGDDAPDLADAGEETLRAEAERAREGIAAQREEAEEARRELSSEPDGG
jgi:hypothetical protein